MSARWFLGIFTRDIKNKVFAFFFAVTIWYFAWNNQITTSPYGDVKVTITPDEERGGGASYELVRVSPVPPEEGGAGFSGYVRKEEGGVAFSGLVSLRLTGPQRDVREVAWKHIEGLVKVHPEDWVEQEERGMLNGSVVLTSEHAPEGLGATAQGVYSGTTMGLAGMTGSLVGGWLYDMAGVANLFRVCSLAAVLALALLLLSGRARPAAARDA